MLIKFKKMPMSFKTQSVHLKITHIRLKIVVQKVVCSQWRYKEV